MTTAPTVSEYVGVGLYALGDAAKLLHSPPRNIRRWLDGYVYKDHAGEEHRMPPLWNADLPKADDHIELSFRDLIELRFVKAFVDAGIGLKAIRNCLNYARSCVESDRPFSSGQFRTDGKTIFLESLERAGEPKLLDLRKKQYVFKQIVDRSFKDLDLEDDAVARWRPFHGKPSIVIDPDRAFGQPIAAGFGVPTIVLAEAVKAEGSEARVARLFEVPPSVVRDAVRFENELLAA
jgi:uncharacterized protein (DUF433 family)